VVWRGWPSCVFCCARRPARRSRDWSDRFPKDDYPQAGHRPPLTLARGHGRGELGVTYSSVRFPLQNSNFPSSGIDEWTTDGTVRVGRHRSIQVNPARRSRSTTSNGAITGSHASDTTTCVRPSRSWNARRAVRLSFLALDTGGPSTPPWR
jgi:hypothetical protein